MVQLQKKLSFAVDPGELPVPICLPDCQTECKTKWGRRFANEIEEEEITVQNPKFDDNENKYKEHVSKLHTYVGCRNVYPSLKRLVYYTTIRLRVCECEATYILLSSRERVRSAVFWEGPPNNQLQPILKIVYIYCLFFF